MLTIRLKKMFKEGYYYPKSIDDFHYLRKKEIPYNKIIMTGLLFEDILNEIKYINERLYSIL